MVRFNQKLEKTRLAKELKNCNKWLRTQPEPDCGKGFLDPSNVIIPWNEMSGFSERWLFSGLKDSYIISENQKEKERWNKLHQNLNQ